MKKIILLYLLFLTGINIQAQNTQWYPLAQGTDSLVTTIATGDSVIYISGTFKNAFGFSANNFGIYNTVKRIGVNPGTGFTNGYAKTFLNFAGIEYAGGTFKNYFSQFNLLTKTWDSIIPVNSPVIRIDTFQSKIVIATDSIVMLYDTGTHQVTSVPQNFRGRLTDIAVYQNKIWIAAYANSADTVSNLYTWDGNTISDSVFANKGIIYLYSDSHFLFISGQEVGGSSGNGVAIYGGGSFSTISNSWSFALFPVGFVTTISGSSQSGYLFTGSFKLIDADDDYHPAAWYKNGTVTVLGDNMKGTASGSCFTPDGTPVTVGSFTLADSNRIYRVAILGESTGINKAETLKPVLYPNPFHERFILKNITTTDKYSLYDELGRRIKEIDPIGNEFIFQDAFMPAGLYFLKETTHPATVLTIIKQ